MSPMMPCCCWKLIVQGLIWSLCLLSSSSLFHHNMFMNKLSGKQIGAISENDRFSAGLYADGLRIHHLLSDEKIKIEVDDSELHITHDFISFTHRPVFESRFEEIFGFYDLPAGKYMLVVSRSECIESEIFKDIRKVQEFKLIKIDNQRKISRETKEKQKFAEMILLQTLKRHTFYFSRANYDILQSYQANFYQLDISEPDYFFWNKDVIDPLLRQDEFSPFVTKFCNAFMKSIDLEIETQIYRFTLISRRAKARQGPRYLKRGADAHGNAANFVETEQIVYNVDNPTKVSSFVQIRGSIPLLWNQTDPWKLKPKVQILDNHEENLSVLWKHLCGLISRYLPNQVLSTCRTGPEETPRINCVNLINKKSSEGKLGSLWFGLSKYLSKRLEYPESSSGLLKPDNPLPVNLSSLFSNYSALLDRDEITSELTSIPNLQADACNESNILMKMIWFDYHHLMKENGNHHRHFQTLYAQLKSCFLRHNGFFSVDNSRDICLSNQTTIIRSNCMDCLDRTNVIQTTISRWAFLQQINSLGGKLACLPSSLALPSQESEFAFRKLWTENGDVLSLLYAGSRAMKRDVTATGKRTRRGLFNDGISFLQRYFANNYRDQHYQNGINFLVNNTLSFDRFSPSPSSESTESSPFFEEDSEVEELHFADADGKVPNATALQEGLVFGLTAMTVYLMLL